MLTIFVQRSVAKIPTALVWLWYASRSVKHLKFSIAQQQEVKSQQADVHMDINLSIRYHAHTLRYFCKNSFWPGKAEFRYAFVMQAEIPSSVLDTVAGCRLNSPLPLSLQALPGIPILPQTRDAGPIPGNPASGIDVGCLMAHSIPRESTCIIHRAHGKASLSGSWLGARR